MVKFKLNIKLNFMQIIYQIIKKGNRTIFSLTLLMILTVVIMNYHNYKKSINETNIKNLINNVYFKKTLTNIFSQFDPKYEKINHNVLKGQSLSNILDKYSVNKNELELVKKSLVKKYKVNNLKINDLLEFTIDRSNQKIIEFSYPANLIFHLGRQDLSLVPLVPRKYCGRFCRQILLLYLLLMDNSEHLET